MIYQAELTIPAQTPQGTPEIASFTLPFGVIKRIAILFPGGCAGLAHIQIFHNEYQVWPTTPGKSFLGDNTYLSFEENYELGDAWNNVKVVGWNDDDSYEHAIDVWLEELPMVASWNIVGLTGIPRYEEKG